MSVKNKSPWITINGKNVADSQLSIEYLKKELNIDANSHLSPREKGIATSVRIMMEEHMYFVGGAEAYVHHGGKHIFTHYPPGLLPLPKFMIKILLATLMKREINKMFYYQGIGRHTHEEQQRIGLKELQAVNDVLGDNKFLMGDKPCDEDAAVFGLLSWPLCCNTDDNFYNIELKKFPKLMAYFERIKDAYWKDWKDRRYPSKE